MIFWSINSYDSDGDAYESGIYLHIGDLRLRVADTPADFRRFADDIKSMCGEIEENWAVKEVQP